MTYKELYDDAIWQLESGKITVGEFDKRVEPLNAEVRKKGKWGDFWKCSICEKQFEVATKYRMNFCPNCGADMRGEES